MANVIYRGPVEREPKTINLVINDTSSPGVVVKLNAGKLEAATDAKGRRFLLANRRFAGQTIDQAYTKGDTAIAFRLEPEHEYYAQLADDTYQPGDALTAKTGGKLAKAVAGDVVLFFFDEQKQRQITGGKGWGDVVVANAYVKA
ncbi:hypothetical protein ACFGWO_07530 [Pasteurella multocida]|uniref:hypothetical protein n=1 Tax=Pasteurella multocida TaxID=747 RepID=UPI00233FD63D|nr:hypothetical protein [Pasteurella multocida]MDC4238386.1 hypothetical protein [Pasteurella multocida]HDR1174444.1 hypothetical protein [Pasteurella multocida]HDR1911744.1 hypothetical protein [Pasteurella multocida]